MANDVTNKSTSSVSGTGNVGNHPENNNSGLPNSTPTAADQQKVPPLRIVLNTAGNQKSSSTIIAENNQVSSTRKERHNSSQDAHNNTLKSRVRIKLGTNRQQASNNNNNSISRERALNESTTNRSTGTTRVHSNEDNFNYDNSTSSFTHLRRITRRSQRTIQSVSIEDEESISSMTSIDENLQNTTTNTDSIAQDSEQSNPATTTSVTGTTSAATNGSNSNTVETPRRYKRRKGETSESQSLDGDAIFGSQNYKLPDQNSIELFKNIRKQVDKRLRNLNSIHPKAPYGFRDYMLSRGAYLLDGNKLGNGTNLFINEDGGLNPPPMGKYHVIRHNRVNYTLPNRAKVPLGLAVNSPLYELFIEQEKERHRMRMQHVKEREKLTLAAEQEIVRVYNQAALLASNQTEPFSACTMLKHQEIYDYLNSDGKIILSRENAQQEQAKTDGVRTRRRQHGHISPNTTTGANTSNSQSRKNSNTDEVATSAQEADTSKEDKTLTATVTSDITVSVPVTTGRKEGESNSQSPTENVGKKAIGDNLSDTQADDKRLFEADKNVNLDKDKSQDEFKQNQSNLSVGQSNSMGDKFRDKNEKSSKEMPEQEVTRKTGNSSLTFSQNDDPTNRNTNVKEELMEVDESTKPIDSKFNQSEYIICGEETKSSTNDDLPGGEASDQNSEESQQDPLQPRNDASSTISSDEDKRAYNKELFLTKLQEVDDKWDIIRKEMLIRHRNEAESLYAIQKLEWEWKTKEIGACDVRATPVIDSTLVPKLNIYSQDY